jgi:hypothetical protein
MLIERERERERERENRISIVISDIRVRILTSVSVLKTIKTSRKKTNYTFDEEDQILES